MSDSQPSCPSCQSTHIVKNGRIHNGKQNFKCRECGRQLVQDAQNKIIAQATKTLIDKLLLEKIPRFWYCQSSRRFRALAPLRQSEIPECAPSSGSTG